MLEKESTFRSPFKIQACPPLGLHTPLYEEMPFNVHPQSGPLQVGAHKHMALSRDKQVPAF